MSTEPYPRRLAAILIADAVGFSKLIGADETGTLDRLKERSNLIERAVSGHGGRVFGGAGDSVIAEFASAVEAVTAAVEMQAAIAAANAALPANDRLEFRVGINLGDVVVEEANLFGDGVNVAERLQALATPGGICIAASVHEQVRGRLPLAFRDLGEKSLKNIVHPVHVFSVGPVVERDDPALHRGSGFGPRAKAVLAAAGSALGVAIFWLALSGAPPAPEPPRSGQPLVAVLPFANLSGDPAQDYFGQGVAGDISAALGRFPGIGVIASNAVAQFHGGKSDPADVRQKVGADFLVDGSVRQSENRLRVSVSLMETGRGQQLWSQQYDREMGDIFKVQDEIVQTVAGHLIAELGRVEHERTIGKPPESLDAYDLLLRGRFARDRRTREANAEARDFFERAVARDPRFAAALAELGYTYLLDASEGWTEFYDDALGNAQKLAERALAIDPDLADGHQLLGDVYSARKDFDRALAELGKAIEINPSSASSFADQAWTLLFVGDADAAIHAMETALKLDPALNFEDRHTLGFAYFQVGRYSDAVSVLEPLAERNLFYFPSVGLAASYAELGRTEDARRAAEQVRRLWPFFNIAEFVAQWRDPSSAAKLTAALRKAGLE